MSEPTSQVRDNRLSGADYVGECWIWRHGKDKDGYGFIKMRGGRRVKIHRASYETFIGPIDAGNEVCHICDTPSCFAPAHLFQGSTQQNKDDSIAKDRHVRGERAWKAKLTEAQVLEIRRDLRPSRAICTEYGVTPETIQMIKRRAIWKHLP